MSGVSTAWSVALSPQNQTSSVSTPLRGRHSAAIATSVTVSLSSRGVGTQLCDAATDVVVDDAFVGDGYAIATDGSREAQLLMARNEAVFVDHTYTAKALAALIAPKLGAALAAGWLVVGHRAHASGEVGAPL